jgi:2,3-bisphosphoglycerate-independent phosphoglycerate mutase
MVALASTRPRPIVLCILDGFGEREAKDDNAITRATTPALDRIRASAAHTLIGTSGPDVGLPPGQMGNSEVGHLNFGAGRIAQMDITRIDSAVADGSLGDNAILRCQVELAKARGRPLHLLGLVSNGGVHASLEHLHALIDVAHRAAVPVVVHAFLDGRDTPPKSAWSFLEPLERHLKDGDKGVIGTLAGRYWAMDRDKRWDRVEKAYAAIVRGEAERARTAEEALRASYAAGKNDEFVEPVCLGDYGGLGRGTAEVGFAFNFRPDRMRELSAMLTRRGLPAEVDAALTARFGPAAAFAAGDYATMTEYDPALGLAVAFPKEAIRASFPEVLARAGLTQFRCAETEKYAHVTYFFNGGREAPFDGEDRALVPSPRDVATYDLKPAMSAVGVTAKVVEAIDSGKYDFVLVNFANPDMVGHTGQLDAAISAVEAVDRGLDVIDRAVRAAGGALFITADHGNCEQMKDERGEPHTAHTLNPVPLYYVNEADPGAKLRPGRICDVAPTMLELMGLDAPVEMTGRSLRISSVSRASRAR